MPYEPDTLAPLNEATFTAADLIARGGKAWSFDDEDQWMAMLVDLSGMWPRLWVILEDTCAGGGTVVKYRGSMAFNDPQKGRYIRVWQNDGSLQPIFVPSRAPASQGAWTALTWSNDPTRDLYDYARPRGGKPVRPKGATRRARP